MNTKPSAAQQKYRGRRGIIESGFDPEIWPSEPNPDPTLTYMREGLL